MMFPELVIAGNVIELVLPTELAGAMQSAISQARPMGKAEVKIGSVTIRVRVTWDGYTPKEPVTHEAAGDK